MPECIKSMKKKIVGIIKVPSHLNPFRRENNPGNVLSLTNQLGLSLNAGPVPEQTLLDLLAEHQLNSTVISDEQERQKVVCVLVNALNKLSKGIYVDVKFNRIDDFNSEGECQIFDLLRIPLYHGWIIHPLDHDTQIAIGEKSFNELMLDRAGRDTDITEQGELIDEFLKKQLTVSGLTSLQDRLRESEPCAFFWNDHFHTMIKRGGKLYILVTDQVFLGYYEDYVWQKLENVNGASGFYDSFFVERKPNHYRSKMEKMLYGWCPSEVHMSSDQVLATDLQQQKFFQEADPDMMQPPLPAPSCQEPDAGGQVEGDAMGEFQKITLPAEVMERIIWQHISSLKSAAMFLIVSKRMAENAILIQDIKLVGDDEEGTLAEKNSHVPAHIGLQKCVGLFDAIEFEPLFDGSNYYLLGELIARTDRALSAFKTFQNLKSVSLKFPPYRGQMDQSSAFFWKCDFMAALNSFIFVSPVQIKPPAGVNTGRVRASKSFFDADVKSIKKKLQADFLLCYNDAMSRASITKGIIMNLPNLMKISITGSDKRKIGNIYLKGEKLKAIRVLLEGYGDYKIDPRLEVSPTKEMDIWEFNAPNSGYVFNGVRVLMTEWVWNPFSFEELFSSDTRGDDESLIESAYMEVLRYVVDNIHMMVRV